MLAKPWLPRLFRRLDLSRSIGAIAHSNACGADLVQLGFPAEAVLVARCGCNLDQYEVVSQAEARAQLELPASARIVAYAGNVAAAKGIDEVLALAAALPDITLLLIGGRPDQITE